MRGPSRARPVPVPRLPAVRNRPRLRSVPSVPTRRGGGREGAFR
ncbi:hypothetical protein SSCG_03119 [Streptomyces clavuligerus]|nr:hypothetical protein SSCG_03119 [Streptomyces clavuligerus]